MTQGSIMEHLWLKELWFAQVQEKNLAVLRAGESVVWVLT